MALVTVAPLDEFPPGSVKIVHAGEISVGVYNLGGRLCALEDRCSHDNGPLCEGEFDPEEGVAVCPRHGARIEICTGKPLSLPAVFPVETFPVTVEDGIVKVGHSLMLDDKVRAVLARLEAEDAKEREEGVPREQRARQVARSTGQFLFALVAPQWDCEVLEIGGSRGYSSIWLGAGVRHLGGRVLSLEADPAKCEAWRRNVAEAGLEESVELVEGDAFETLPQINDVFDIVFIDAEKEDYERLFELARDKVEPGGLFVADNVLSHRRRSARTRRPARPTRRSRASPSRSTAASSSRSP